MMWTKVILLALVACWATSVHATEVYSFDAESVGIQKPEQAKKDTSLLTCGSKFGLQATVLADKILSWTHDGGVKRDSPDFTPYSTTFKFACDLDRPLRYGDKVRISTGDVYMTHSLTSMGTVAVDTCKKAEDCEFTLVNPDKPLDIASPIKYDGRVALETTRKSGDDEFTIFLKVVTSNTERVQLRANLDAFTRFAVLKIESSGKAPPKPIKKETKPKAKKAPKKKEKVDKKAVKAAVKNALKKAAAKVKDDAKKAAKKASKKAAKQGGKKAKGGAAKAKKITKKSGKKVKKSSKKVTKSFLALEETQEPAYCKQFCSHSCGFACRKSCPSLCPTSAQAPVEMCNQMCSKHCSAACTKNCPTMCPDVNSKPRKMKMGPVVESADENSDPPTEGGVGNIKKMLKSHQIPSNAPKNELKDFAVPVPYIKPGKDTTWTSPAGDPNGDNDQSQTSDPPGPYDVDDSGDENHDDKELASAGPMTIYDAPEAEGDETDEEQYGSKDGDRESEGDDATETEHDAMKQEQDEIKYSSKIPVKRSTEHVLPSYPNDENIQIDATADDDEGIALASDDNADVGAGDGHENSDDSETEDLLIADF